MSIDQPLVSLKQQKNYNQPELEQAVFHLLQPLGGMNAFVSPGATVVLKPNLVMGYAPDKAVNTHPGIVRAVAKAVKKSGAGKILVGDSPGMGSARAAAKTCGILAVCEELGLELIEFTPQESFDPTRVFPKLNIARELLEAEVIINLPKLKTHGQMLMTMAVKNMFGAVVGAEKLQWHYRAGRDRLLFARAINEIALAVKPQLSIMDAITGMDGAGPTAGKPNHLGILAASGDPFSLDAIMLDILGIPREELFTLQAAKQQGVTGWETAKAVGGEISQFQPKNWHVPELVTLQMHGNWLEKHLPAVGRYLRSQLTPRPKLKAGCVRCGHCVNICPAKAMQMTGKGVMINHDLCIRCYCCHELCPHDGMDLQAVGLLGRLLGLRKK